MPRMRALWIALVSLAGCADETTIRVVVESDLAIPAQLDEVVVEVGGQSAIARLEDASSLPATLVLRASGDALGPFEVRVVGKRGGAEAISVVRSIAFQPGATTTVTVRLEAACLGVPCAAGTRCEAGTCVPDGTSDAGVIDAGGGDASGPDASGPDAGGPDACTAEVCNAADDDCDGATDEAGCEPCERTEATGGHVYLACDILHSWDAARAYCQGVGYDLVTIDGAAENSGVERASLGADPWLGLRREAGGALAWADGTPYGAYTNWQGGEPSAGRDCVVQRRSNGRWTDEVCAAAHPFVCEHAP